MNEPSIATTLSSVDMASVKPAQNLSSSTVIAKKAEDLKKVEELLLHFDKARLSEKRKLAPDVYNIATSKETDPTIRKKAISLMCSSVDKEMHQKGEEAKKLYKNELSSSSSNQNITPLLISQKKATSEPSNLNPSLQLSKKLKNNSAALTAPNTIISAKNKKVTNGPNIGTPQASKDSLSHRVKNKRLLQKLGVKETPETTRVLEQCCLEHLTDGQMTRLSILIKTNPMQLKEPILITPILTKIQINLWENFCKFGKPLITKKMNDKQKVEVLEAFVETKIFTDPFIEAVISLTEDLNHGDRVNVIKTLAKIGPKDLTPEFIQAITSLTNYLTSGLICRMPEDRVAVIEALLKIRPEYLTTFKYAATPFLSNNTPIKHSVAAIEAFAEVEPENLTIFEDVTFFGTNTVWKGQVSVFKALIKMGSKNYAIFKDAVTSLATLYPSNNDFRRTIVEAFAETNLENYTALKEVITSLITNYMGDLEKVSIVRALVDIAEKEPKNLTILKNVATSLITNDTHNSDRVSIIHALVNIVKKEPKNLTTFEDIVISLIPEDDYYKNTGYYRDRATFIRSLAKKGLATNFSPEFINTMTALVKHKNIQGFQILIEALPYVKIDDITDGFVQAVDSLFSKVGPLFSNVDDNFSRVGLSPDSIQERKKGHLRDIIKILAKIKPKNLELFKDAAISLITNDMYGSRYLSVIKDLANVESKTDFTPQFIHAAIPLATKYKDNGRDLIMSTLGYLKPEYLTLQCIQEEIFPLSAKYENASDLHISILALPYVRGGHLREDRFTIFKNAAISLLSNHIETTSYIIYHLVQVPTEKQEFVYPYIHALVNRSQVKFNWKEHVSYLIETLVSFDQQTAATFVAGVIHLVERDKTNNVRVGEDRLITHIETMCTQLTRTPQDETRELLTHRQSTHKKEAHESIAMSLKKLEKRYPDAFQVGNVFEVVKAKLKSFSRNDTEDLFKSAVKDFKETYKNLNIGLEIDKLLTINPYIRAGANDEDTLLNQRMRTFLQPFQENQEFRKDVESLVGKYSRMKDYDNALKVIRFMERESGYKDQMLGMSFAQKLSLIYAALTDRKSQKSGDKELTYQDIEDRWGVLFARYAKVYHEYGKSSSCTGGIFNAGVEALDRVHPDVNIIQNFRAFMQEISLEEDDKEYEKRVEIALSHLGEKAQKDLYYQDEIGAWKDARKEKKAEKKASKENEEELHKRALPLSPSPKDEKE